MSLLALTTLILGIAALVAAGVAWHLWRETRARAVARVRALEAAIDDRVDRREIIEPWSPGVVRQQRAPADRLDRRPLFASSAAGAQTSGRMGPAFGVGAVVVSSVVAALFFFGGDRGTATDSPTPTPIDLVSMRHVDERADFVVTGLVRNPHDGRPRQGVSAVVFFFDDRGGFITSAKAPLEFSTLGPGEESPFVVKIPRPAGLERYRLSFRAADGTVLPHVDRRGGDTR